MQAGNLFRLMKPDKKKRVIENLVGAMKSVLREIQERQVARFAEGSGVWQGRGRGARLARFKGRVV